MARELKVHGFTAMNPHTEGKVKGAQIRIIVAAHSVAEVMRITGHSRADYNWTGAVTANEDEVAQAMAEPGVAYFQTLNAPRSDQRWYVYPGARKRSYDPLVHKQPVAINYDGKSRRGGIARSHTPLPEPRDPMPHELAEGEPEPPRTVGQILFDTMKQARPVTLPTIECPLCEGTGLTSRENYRYNHTGTECAGCSGTGRVERGVVAAWKLGYEQGRLSAYIGKYDQFDQGSLMFQKRPEHTPFKTETS